MSWQQPTVTEYSQDNVKIIHVHWLYPGEGILSLSLYGDRHIHTSNGDVHSDLCFMLSRHDVDRSKTLIAASTPEELEQKVMELSPYLPLPEDYKVEWERARDYISE